MKRAVETAEIIKEEIKYPKKIEIFNELIELRRGKMSGLAEDNKYRKKIEKEIKKNKKRLETRLSIFMNLIWINI
jgi:broad specificity phosphatase PhoE